MDLERVLLEVLLDISLVILAASVISPLCSRMRQPVVVGLLLLGLIVGLLPHRVSTTLFPTDARPFLNVVAQIALVLFLFTMGYELDLRSLRRNARSVAAVAFGATVTPLVLGAAFGLSLLGSGLGARTRGGPGSFVLFMAIALSITALPVLSWILVDREIATTRPGVVALAASGMMDMVMWPLLIGVIAVSTADNRKLITALVFLPVYILAMIFVVRPLLRRIMDGRYHPQTVAPMIIALLMASAWATGRIGLHVYLGALLMGAITPRSENGVADAELLNAVDRAGTALLPVFFVVTGLTVRLNGLHATDWLVGLAACALATLGKLGGGSAAGRLGGLDARTSLITGVLVNTRGLTELIALSAAWQAGLIGSRLFTVLVVMALVTTSMTGPLLSLLKVEGPSSGATRRSLVTSGSNR